MCFPGAAAAGQLAIGAASSMAQYQAGQDQFAAKEVQYNQNYQEALAFNRSDEEALTERQMQEQGAFAQKDHLALIEGAQKGAQISVSAAAGGVSGPVVSSLLEGIGQAINDKRTTLETNWKNTASQLQAQKNSSVTEEQMRIGEVGQPINPGLGAALGAGISTSGDALRVASTPSGEAGVSALGGGAGINLGQM